MADPLSSPASMISADSSARMLHMAATTMGDFRRDMESLIEASNKVSGKTRTILRIISLILIASASLLMILITVLALDIHSVIKDTETMYLDFHKMSGLVERMGMDVAMLNKNTKGITNIAENMHAMNHSVGAMRQDVGTMSGQLAQMDQLTANIRGSVTEMAGRFSQLTSTVFHLGSDVNRMTVPANSMNKMMDTMKMTPMGGVIPP